MKKSYHITTTGDETDRLSSALRVLNLSADTVIVSTDNSGRVCCETIIGLSKYELLYVRLCVPMKIVEIPSE